MKYFCLHLLAVFFTAISIAQSSNSYRPKIHFSPKQHWINDPNGMVYSNGVYHLFFQYYPDGIVWGPMHWGHTASKDLVHWQEQPIALYPDSIGLIFSGSAVVDAANTSGFGKGGKAPLVAVFTQHDMVGEKSNTSDTFQTQSIAYSTDDGKTWTKYKGNPVLRNPGIRDFRDPKVMWYAPQKKWIMMLATKDRVSFYSSPNLKQWKKESEFGQNVGAHGGVWECPDLVEMTDANWKKAWVLIASINPSGPYGGSATQYFIGSFNGHRFTSSQTETRWIDYGPDNYAGITWNNTGNRKIFLGWMSNWDYANQLPTASEGWRNAMTIPRELKLVQVGNKTYLASQPVAELKYITEQPVVVKNGIAADMVFPACINLQADASKDFTLRFSNAVGEELLIGYEANKKSFFINRTHSGKVDFSDKFSKIATAPRFATSNLLNLSLVLDASSVELFADHGLTVITSLFFPNQPYNKLGSLLQNNGLKKLEIAKMEPAPVTMAATK